MISVHFQGESLSITVIQDYAPITDAKEAEVEKFYEDLQDLLELTPKKMFFSPYGTGLQKWKSRDTWSSRQAWPWSTK